MPATPFVHLRLHTEFSIVDSTVRIEPALAQAASDGQPALALTDLANIFGAIKFYKGAMAQGIKPIIGADIWVTGFGEAQEEPLGRAAQGAAAGAAIPAPLARPTRLLLLVMNHAGYLNLCTLLSLAWMQSAHPTQAVIRARDLRPYAQGLIALSGAQEGALGQACLNQQEARALVIAQDLQRTFAGRFYIELQRAGRPSDEVHIHAAVQVARQLGLPVVATHPIEFMHPEDYEAHEARVCIAQGEVLSNQRRARAFTQEQSFQSTQQMQRRFADIPSALANTVEIARRCSLALPLGKPHLPLYPTPLAGGVPVPIDVYFRAQSLSGLQARLAFLFPDPAVRAQKQPLYLERLEFEIQTILKMDFPGYFLIVGDFIQWAKNNGCPVGPGRGSGAGSLVAYALQITDIDPIEYNLLFERFLNPERVSMPDFDIDFCQSNRDRVIDYVKNKYGSQAVSQIVTFGTMAARGVVRDVGRVLDLPYSYCDGISKLIPNKPGTQVSLAQALIDEPEFKQRHAQEEDLQTLMTLALKLEGLTRNVGMHAGGVVIAPGKLTDFCPLYQPLGSNAAVSQFDKDDVEAIGLVKFDFLGLATLTILEIAKDLVRTRHPTQAAFTLSALRLDDPEVYRLFSKANTEAVFQFESSGMRATLKEAKPSRFEDLIALNALYRPGPMDNIPSFVARKHDKEEIVYPHPLVEPLLSETYGVIVYQEQVMQTAQILGNYTLGGADLLRRAMGKKKPEEMAQHRALFRAGCAKNNIEASQADEIFDLMEKFAGYGFNKSHAAAYSLLAYQTAWLKVHYRVEFYCANMTVEMGNTDKLKVLVNDAKANGIGFEPPDINQSDFVFTPIDDRTVRYGLGAIKGTGQQAVQAMLEARATAPFTSLFDFLSRVDKTKLNKRAVEALIKAGAFDGLHSNRAATLASVDLAFDFAATQARNALQSGLFDDAHGSSAEEPALVACEPWGLREQLIHERSAVGFYLTGHLFDIYASEARQFVSRTLANVSESREPQLLCGIVGNLRVVNTSNRGRIAIFTLDDKAGQIEASLDEALWVTHKDVLVQDAFVVVQAKVQLDRFNGGGFRLNVSAVWDGVSARCHFGKHLLLRPSADQRALGERQLCAALMHVLREWPPKMQMSPQGEYAQGMTIRLEHIVPIDKEAQKADQQGSGNAVADLVLEGIWGVQLTLELGEEARFYPSDEALSAWSDALGTEQVRIVY